MAGEREGGLKLNGKLCTSIKTRGEHIKSHTPMPGDRMQEGEMQYEATVQSESPGFLATPQDRGRRGGETGRLGE